MNALEMTNDGQYVHKMKYYSATSQNVTEKKELIWWSWGNKIVRKQFSYTGLLLFFITVKQIHLKF
jgi:hypothetical protein